MALQFAPYVVLQVGTVALVVGLGIAVWRYRSGEPRLPFVLGMAAVGVWMLADAGQMASTARAEKLLWYRIGYVGVVAVPTAWFLFLIRFAKRDEWLTRKRLALLGIEPLLALAFVWSDHDYFIERFDVVSVTYLTDRELLRIGPVELVEIVPGPLFWVNVGYSYLILTLGAFAVVSHVRGRSAIYRSQAKILLSGMLLPWVTNLAVLSGAIATPLELTPIAFTAMGLVFAWALLRHRLFEPIPLAREAVVEELDAGVVVLDDEHRISATNPAASRVLGLNGTEPEGEPLTTVFPDDVAIERLVEDGNRQEEITINTPDRHRHLDVRVTSLTENGHQVGRLLVFRDVTDRVLRRQRLEVLSRILRHNVRNDMNLVLGHAQELIRNAETGESRHAHVIEETASDLVAVSDKARTVERQLRGEDKRTAGSVDLVEQVREIVTELAPDYPDVDLEVDLPRSVRTDGAAVVAVRELVENALEHGSGNVRISATEREEAVEVTVEDDGPGIPEAERAVLTKGHETALEHGSGLGLWIVNWIVHSTGGDLGFESSDLGGTCVCMRVPVTADRE